MYLPAFPTIFVEFFTNKMYLVAVFTPISIDECDKICQARRQENVAFEF